MSKIRVKPQHVMARHGTHRFDAKSRLLSHGEFRREKMAENVAGETRLDRKNECTPRELVAESRFEKTCKAQTSLSKTEEGYKFCVVRVSTMKLMNFSPSDVGEHRHAIDDSREHNDDR